VWPGVWPYAGSVRSPGRSSVAPSKGLHAASGHIGTYRWLHLFVKTFGRLGIALAGGLVRPEIELSLVHVDGGIREDHRAADRETAGVIGMDVRDQDVGDVLGLHAGGTQTIRHLRKLWSEQVTRPGVHENCVAREIDQEGVDRRIQPAA